jgi:hypothetical protein
MMKKALIITLMLTLSLASVLAQPQILAGVSCPSTVYQNELFTCIVSIYNNGVDDTNISYYVHFNKGLASVTSASSGRLTLDSFVIAERNFPCWAEQKGADIFTFEYGQKDTDSVVGKRVVVVQSPIQLTLERFKVTAGQRTTVKAGLEGKGDLVTVHIDLPPGVYGTKDIDVGDVAGKVEFNVSVSTDPYFVGSVRIPFYVHFFDKAGEHTLRYDVIMDVEPSLQMLAFGAAAVVLALLLIYLGYRQIRGGASVGRPPVEKEES